MGDLYGTDAWVYDAAFAWDVTGEVDWLLDRLGPGVERLLEPFCGNGRMFPPFARRGVAIAGVDRSEEMLAFARARMAREGLPPPRLLRADVADFDLGETFDGAICPVNSFAHLVESADARAHLECVARHLKPGARYLLQLDLRPADLVPLTGPQEQGRWIADHPDGRIAASWYVRDLSPSGILETHVSRFEILDGPRQGQVVEDTHVMRRWDWGTFSALVAASPFTEVGAYDGNRSNRPALPVGPGLDGAQLTWHVLQYRNRARPA